MLEHIERFVRAGYDLEVHLFGPATSTVTKIRARVVATKGVDTHNYLGNDVDDALAGLNVFLFAKQPGSGT